MAVSFSMLIEVSVVVLGFLYVILIAMEKRIGWIAGVAGSALFVASNLEQHLYMDSILNSYYVLAGIYGWYIWGTVRPGTDMPVAKIGITFLLGLMVFAMVLTVIFGFLLSHYTDSSMPYLDAGVTILSFIATWMSTKKYVENWLVWLVADPLAIILYAVKGAWFYPVLFAAYTIMAIYGYIKWKKHLQHAV